MAIKAKVTVLDEPTRKISITATWTVGEDVVTAGPLVGTVDLSKPAAELARLRDGLRADYVRKTTKATKVADIVATIEDAVAAALTAQEA